MILDESVSSMWSVGQRDNTNIALALWEYFCLNLIETIILLYLIEYTNINSVHFKFRSISNMLIRSHLLTI